MVDTALVASKSRDNRKSHHRGRVAVITSKQLCFSDYINKIQVNRILWRGMTVEDAAGRTWWLVRKSMKRGMVRYEFRRIMF